MSFHDVTLPWPLPARVVRVTDLVSAALPAIGGGTPSRMGNYVSRSLSSWAEGRREMGGSSLLYTGDDRTLVRFSGPRKPRRWKAGERAPWGRRKKHRDALTREDRRVLGWLAEVRAWLGVSR